MEKGGKMEKIEAKVDERGRIVIPAAVRRKMGIRPLSRVEILIKSVVHWSPF
jgi:AbrB family looped-hinge helix DNA binding protein